MSLPARFQRARHPLGAHRRQPMVPVPLTISRPAPRPTPEYIREAMRAGSARAERLRRWLDDERFTVYVTISFPAPRPEGVRYASCTY